MGPAAHPVVSESERITQAIDQLMQDIQLGLNQSDLDADSAITIERHTKDSIKLTFGGNELFQSGKAEISATMKSNLHNLVTVLSLQPDSVVHVIGHTDSSGKSSWNQKLSEKRANAVATHLISLGYRANHIVSHGYGETSPTADNSTSEGRALNRRMEIYIRHIIRGQEDLASTPPS